MTMHHWVSNAAASDIPLSPTLSMFMQKYHLSDPKHHKLFLSNCLIKP